MNAVLGIRMDPLTEQLKAWGNATVARFARIEDGPSAGDHILARQRDMGLQAKRKREEEREIVGRSGEARRRFMATKMKDARGRQLLSIVPAWAVDPVCGSNDADAPRERSAAMVDMGIPDELRWIDSALARLERVHPVRAMVVREEFTGRRGTQVEKAARIRAKYGGRFSDRDYRRELERAIDWLGAKAP